jgi:hypothetical protein
LSDLDSPVAAGPPASGPEVVFRLDKRFENDWLAGAAPRIDDDRGAVQESDRAARLQELVRRELGLRLDADEKPTIAHDGTATIRA